MLRRREIRFLLSPVNGRMSRNVETTPKLGSMTEVIGASTGGQPIKVHYFGSAQATLRILVVGGRQGAEPAVHAALDRWASWLGDGDCEARRTRTLESVRLAILPDASPDGTDVSRDCLALQSTESRAIHRMIDCLQPHLIIDISTFAARQKHLLAHDLVLCHDVFLDIPTNPAANEATDNRVDESFLAYAVGQLSRQSVLASRFMRVSRKGSVRHASADLCRGPNLWAVRFGVPTVMIVGPNSQSPGNMDDGVSPRNEFALQAALQTTVDWAIDDQDRLSETSRAPQAGDLITIESRYADHHAPARMIFFRPSSGKLDQVELPGRFSPRLVENRKIEAPQVYGVPRTWRQSLAWLKRQGLRESVPRLVTDGNLRPTHYRSIGPNLPPAQRPRNIELSLDAEEWTARYVLFAVDQPGGHLLSLLLEPHSQYGRAETRGDEPGLIRWEASEAHVRKAA